MAAARPAAPRRAAAHRRRRNPRRVPGIRWDRVGRVALLLVLGLLLLLYIRPASSYVSTWRESKQRHAEVNRLERENVKLRARRAALRDDDALELEARRLGMVKPGERAYVVRRLPR
jgi:cell division protein FtsB